MASLGRDELIDSFPDVSNTGKIKATTTTKREHHQQQNSNGEMGEEAAGSSWWYTRTWEFV